MRVRGEQRETRLVCGGITRTLHTVVAFASRSFIHSFPFIVTSPVTPITGLHSLIQRTPHSSMLIPPPRINHSMIQQRVARVARDSGEGTSSLPSRFRDSVQDRQMVLAGGTLVVPWAVCVSRPFQSSQDRNTFPRSSAPPLRSGFRHAKRCHKPAL